MNDVFIKVYEGGVSMAGVRYSVVIPPSGFTQSWQLSQKVQNYTLNAQLQLHNIKPTQ